MPHSFAWTQRMKEYEKNMKLPAVEQALRTKAISSLC
jgi:hypothetical protein